MNTIKGPGIFLAQFLRDEKPFNSIEGITEWAASLGYKGIQVPSWDARAIDLDKAASSSSYCEEYKSLVEANGVKLIELGSYLQGQVMAMHPAYEEMFQPFYPEGMKDRERTEWAQEQMMKSVDASVNLGTKNISVLSGGLAWHMVYPWPQRPDGLIDEAFSELASRWKPVLDYAHFLLQKMDYLAFIEIFGKRITAFHVKDAEFRPSGRMGVYGGYQNWQQRAGRFRSLGDGQVDFHRVFTLLTEAGYDGWAILEWECCIKSSEQGAREGARFIDDHIIVVSEYRFDDFAGGNSDRSRNRRILGLGE